MHSMTRVIGLVAATALVAACSKGENKADSAAMADSAAKASAMAPAPTPPPAALTDANIFAMLDEGNAADSAAGSIAATKGTASDVKEFGRDMMKDHHKLRADGQALAKKLNITPAPPANDTLPAAAQREADQLNSAAKGADWDKTYINGQVADHQAVLAMLQNVQGVAQDTSLKAAITKAIPVVQGHLTKAQGIQTKLNAAKP